MLPKRDIIKAIQLVLLRWMPDEYFFLSDKLVNNEKLSFMYLFIVLKAIFYRGTDFFPDRAI